MSPEHIMFSDVKTADRVRKDANVAQYDYRIFDGLKEIKK